jgi:hypothetical protein
MAEEQPQATLRETIEANVAAAREEPVVQTDAPVVETQETEAQRAERVRDEQGRFAKAEAKQGAQAAPAVALQTAPVVEESQLPKPPSSWKKELWPVWEALHKGTITPEQAKSLVDYIPQREQQFATGVSTYKQIADTAKPLLDAVAPFQADLDRHGIPAHDMVGRLMSAHKTLAMGSPQEKLQLFSKLAGDYGIPMQAFFDQNAQQQYLATPHTPAPQAQPDINALVESAIAAREVRQTVESIEKDTQNYPFFQYVRSTMAQLLETNEATDLNDAYQKALERPEHAMLVSFSQQQQERAEQQRQAETRQAAVRVARSNAVSPKSATPMGGPVNEKKDVRSALKDAIAIHAGGARV